MMNLSLSLQTPLSPLVRKQNACPAPKRVGGLAGKPSSVDRCRVVSNSFAGSITDERAGNVDVVQQQQGVQGQVLSTHPDAVRRRQQAEQRQREAEEAMKRFTATSAHGWWEDNLGPNTVLVENPEHFKSILAKEAAGNRLVVVDFFAPWCRACMTLYPKMTQLAANNPEVLFVKVNGGDETLREMCQSLGITRLPYFHFYKDQQLKSHFSANLHKISVLRAEIAAYKS